MLEVPARANEVRKKVKWIHTEKKEVKISLLADDRILYLRGLTDSPNNVGSFPLLLVALQKLIVRLLLLKTQYTLTIGFGRKITIWNLSGSFLLAGQFSQYPKVLCKLLEEKSNQQSHQSVKAESHKNNQPG